MMRTNVQISLIAFLLAFGTASSKKVPFKNCASETQLENLGEITSLDVTPCEGDPCVFKHGANETVTVSFIPREVVTRAKIYVYAIKWGMRFPLPVPNPNACNGYGLTCPLKNGVRVELTFTDEVPEYCPSGSYSLEAVLKDQNGNTVTCGIFDLKIA